MELAAEEPVVPLAMGEEPDDDVVDPDAIVDVDTLTPELPAVSAVVQTPLDKRRKLLNDKDRIDDLFQKRKVDAGFSTAAFSFFWDEDKAGKKRASEGFAILPDLAYDELVAGVLGSGGITGLPPAAEFLAVSRSAGKKAVEQKSLKPLKVGIAKTSIVERLQRGIPAARKVLDSFDTPGPKKHVVFINLLSGDGAYGSAAVDLQFEKSMGYIGFDYRKHMKDISLMRSIATAGACWEKGRFDITGLARMGESPVRTCFTSKKKELQERMTITSLVDGAIRVPSWEEVPPVMQTDTIKHEWELVTKKAKELGSISQLAAAAAEPQAQSGQGQPRCKMAKWH
jgi:hypothetical protein